MSGPIRLAFFDLDGTLKSAHSTYDYLHQHLGFSAECAAYSSAFYRGEIDYVEWLRRDIALWKGVPAARITALLRDNPYLPGAAELVGRLVAAGVVTILITSGPDLHARMVVEELGMARYEANRLCVEDGVLTGGCETLVPEGAKGSIARRYLAEYGAAPQDCLALGDGTSDVDMFACVGISVAIAPRLPAVAAAARIVLPEPDLTPLLQLLQQIDQAWIAPAG